MQNSFLTGLLTGALAGAVAAVVTTVVITPKSPAREVPILEARDAPMLGVNGLQDELAELSRENADLALRVATLEARPVGIPASRMPLAADELAKALAPEREQAADAALVASKLPQDPEFLFQVQEAVQSIREEETRERELERAAAREERREQRLTELTEKLALDEFQVKEMRVALTAQDERRVELFETVRDGGDRRDIREGMRAISEETRTTLARVLTTEQLEGYREYSEGGRGGEDPNRGAGRGGGDGSNTGGGNRGRRGDQGR